MDATKNTAAQSTEKQIMATCTVKACINGVISPLFECDHCSPLLRAAQSTEFRIYNYGAKFLDGRFAILVGGDVVMFTRESLADINALLPRATAAAEGESVEIVRIASVTK